MELAPICLFTYNRLEETKLTIEHLQKNNLAKESNIYIFSDGAKNESSFNSVQAVRQYLKTVDGFNQITVIEAAVNKGLAESIKSGVTKVISKYGTAIVVEDDLITSVNFLDYMNESLAFYKNIDDVFSISGFCPEIDKSSSEPHDAFFWGRAHSWGWATWLSCWESVDWDIKDWEEFSKDPQKVKEFNSYGTDLFGMLKKSMKGKINSWYIRFNYNQFKQGKLTVYPFKSKVINIGFTEEATHCDTYNRNKIVFDRSVNNDFSLPKVLEIKLSIRKQLFNYKSIRYRIIGKLLTYAMKLGILKQRTKGLIK